MLKKSIFVLLLTALVFGGFSTTGVTFASHEEEYLEWPSCSVISAQRFTVDGQFIECQLFDWGPTAGHLWDVVVNNGNNQCVTITVCAIDREMAEERALDQCIPAGSPN